MNVSKEEAAAAAVFINSLDRERLLPLIERACARTGDAVPGVREVLRRVRQSLELPPQSVPPDLVTMNSTVRLVAADGSRSCELTLVYPEDSDPDEGSWSIFSPVGVALFGRRVGDEVGIEGAASADGRWRIDAILFQPEARGWLTL